jgi:ferritin-like metal-binding protein YciE
MKTSIVDFQSALSVQLETMRNTEELIQSSLTGFARCLTDKQLKDLVKRYARSSRYKRLKLKRMFSYVLRGPFLIKGSPAKEVMRTMDDISKKSVKGITDLLCASTLLGLVHYKVSIYQTAKEMAAYCALEEVSDLLNEILVMENEFIPEIKTCIDQCCNTKARGKE